MYSDRSRDNSTLDGKAKPADHATQAVFRARKRKRNAASDETGVSLPNKLTFWRILAGVSLIGTFVLFLGVPQSGLLWDKTGAPIYFAGLFATLIVMTVWMFTLRSRADWKKTHALAARLEKIEDLSWEVRESEERYRSITEAFGDLVVHRNLDGRILFANDAFCEAFEDQFQYPMSDGVRYFQPDHSADLSGGAQSGPDYSDIAREIQIKTRLGQRWYSWLDLNIRDPATGSPAIISVARDITDQKDYEARLLEARNKAEFASQAKSRFVAHVSHEIRTPLNGILGMADLLKHTRLTPSQTSYVDAVDTSGNALLLLVEDLLDIAKVEANQLELVSEPFELWSLLENVVELLAGTAHEKGIEIGLFIARDVPQTIVADMGKLRQVFLNIMGNAIKFTESGGILVRAVIVQGNDIEQQTSIRFEIHDTGPGLASEDQNRIFEAFEQAESGRDRKHDGAGLGLNISQRIVNKMGSHIVLESILGQGSVFSFELQLPYISSPASQNESAAATENSLLLLAPDNVEREAIHETLVNNGNNVECFETVDDAIIILKNQRAQKNPFKTLIVDFRVLNNDPAVLEVLKDTAASSVKLVTLISPDKRPVVEQLLKHGADGWLVRPVRRRSLFDVINDAKPDGIKVPPIHSGLDNKGAPIKPPLNILLVDDNEINQLLACALLERKGHRFSVVSNGQSALDAINKPTRLGDERFDLILMDLHMPGMDGLETIEKVRLNEKLAEHSPIPIIVLSADEQQSIQDKAITAGANGFLAKPVDAAKLDAAVENVLGALSMEKRRLTAGT